MAALIASLIAIPEFLMTNSNSKNPAKNLHSVKRYNVIATSNAPEAWDSIEGYIGYEIINRECLPMNSFLGQQDVPSIGISIEMIRVDDHTWMGHFFRDAWQDADYYNIGICHWDVTSVGISAVARRVRFNWSHTLNTLLRDGRQTSYFKKSLYGDPGAVRYGAQAFTADDPDVSQSPNAYFPVTIAVQSNIP
ncbi:hypothetical protein [Methylobacterium fujisawaense]|jgi:hypothetical protein